MLIVFCNVRGIAHHEFVPPNTTVNSDFYCDVFRRLRENVQRRKFSATTTGFHHDNAPAQTSLKTTEFVTNNNMVVVPHPPYSTDLASCDFALLPKLKMKLKGRRFETVSDIQRESQAALDSIKENYFHGAFEVWKKPIGSLYMFTRRLF
jgi:transposase